MDKPTPAMFIAFCQVVKKRKKLHGFDVAQKYVNDYLLRYDLTDDQIMEVTKILKSNIRGFIDKSGTLRYNMTIEELQCLYKRLEDFVADCTREEYDENKDAINVVYTLIHKHIKTASNENEHNH